MKKYILFSFFNIFCVNLFAQAPSKSCDSLQENDRLTITCALTKNHDKVQEIYVDARKEKNLVKDLIKFKNLELIYIEYIDYFPEELEKLINLRRLVITNSSFEEIPCNDFLLTHNKLRVIKVQANLKKICSNFTGLPSVRDYDFSNNKLEAIPGNLHFARRLNLKNNLIKEISSSDCHRLSSVKELNLEKNQISKIHTDIGEMSNLELINLSSNKLESIPKELSKCKMLRTIGITNNKQINDISLEIFLGRYMHISARNTNITKERKEYLKSKEPNLNLNIK